MEQAKKIFVIILLLSINFNSYSQVSGYLGKKFIISYTPEITYSLTNPNYKGNCVFDVKLHPFAINMKHNGTVEYVVARNLSLGVDFMYWKTNFYLKNNFSYHNINDPTQSGTFNGKFGQQGIVKVMGFGAYIKIFKRSLAPLGAYTKIKTMLINYSPTATDTSFSYMNKSELAYIQPSKKSYQGIFISATWGKHRIIKNLIVLDMGFEIGTCFCGGMKYLISKNSYSGIASEYLKTESGARIFGGMLINFNIGIGLLAF